ncbi:MAG: ferritin-like domain-containing protein [Gammaproteobacteria bacterium]|nr:MAG: ferritin-like domain-containing protein [Gammaproteobacteria bacterium]
MPEFYRQVEAAILQSDPARKCEQTRQLVQIWEQGVSADADSTPILPIDDPGRPGKPELVDPRQLPRRSFASETGRIRLLHAFAHIEFNAINIALDAVYRFRRMPPDFISDWLSVAAEEAQHFRLLEAELEQRASYYGACPAHSGLWDMVCKTRDNLLHRMALVPRVMEARGLDVTPAMIARFRQFGDDAAVAILEVIYRDEVGHVRIGDYWFRRLCAEQGLDAEKTFRELVDLHMGGRLRGPFNRSARIEAGFRNEELDALERLC